MSLVLLILCLNLDWIGSVSSTLKSLLCTALHVSCIDTALGEVFFLHFPLSFSTRLEHTCTRPWVCGWGMLLRTSFSSTWRVWACSSFRKNFDPSACPCAVLCYRASFRPWPFPTPPTTAGPFSAQPQRRSSPSFQTKARFKLLSHVHIQNCTF